MKLNNLKKLLWRIKFNIFPLTPSQVLKMNTNEFERIKEFLK